MPLLDRIDNSVERLGKRFSSLIDEGQSGGMDWGAAVQQGQGQGINWAGALGQQQGGINWGAAVGQGQQGGDSLFSRYLSGYGSGGGPFNFSGFDMFHQAKNERDMADAARNAATTGQSAADAPGVPGEDFGAPDAATIEKELAGTALAGQAATIQAAAQRRGVPVTALLAIMAQESSYRTPAQGTKYNFGGLKGSGGSGDFADYPDLASGIDAVAANLGSGIYRGLTLSQVINKWAPAGDGNDPAGYTNNAVATIRRLGGNASANSIVVGAPASSVGSTSGMTSIWGGANAPITQGFGRTDYSDQHPDTYAYAGSYGASGHTGLDIGLARGTRLYSPVGGTVTIAGTGGYFRDEDFGDDGNSGKRGEIMIQLDNGDQIILGHTSQINVKAGQRVSAGMLVGLSGSANGAHVHLEVRQKQRDGSYRIVNPQEYFAPVAGPPAPGPQPGPAPSPRQ